MNGVKKKGKYMEQCELERTKPIRNFLTGTADRLLEERVRKIKGMVCGNIENIKDRLFHILDELVSDKEGGGLVISYLRSSYISGSHELYVAYYVEDAFVEEQPDHAYLDMRRLLESAEEDVRELNGSLEKEFIRILSAEKEEVRRWYMDLLYRRLGEVLKAALDGMPKKSGMEVCFGGFMDELEVIGEV